MEVSADWRLGWSWIVIYVYGTGDGVGIVKYICLLWEDMKKLRQRNSMHILSRELELL
jgi:hypothetical protein